MTSIFWIGVMSIRTAIHKLWLISAVKAPTRMALNKIKEEIDRNDIESAKRDFEILRNQWLKFESEPEFGTKAEAMGTIMEKVSEEEKKK